ncbi:MAG: DEAD/DEAH box helicase [Polyangiaceae bacterium]|nr:DEAD/DEAH box helicase [Polyangiaceae bacterium]
MNPHEHQMEAIARVRRSMAQGNRRVVLVIPTGGGKTVIGSAIAKRSVDSGRRVLFLAHRAELIDQAARTLTAHGLTVGALCASATTPPNPYAMVQVASVQTLLARNERPPADLILADECHHFGDAAEQWIALLGGYGSAYVLGLTATPERGDGSGLSGSFDSLVVGATVAELTNLGFLVPCEVMRPDHPLKPGELAQSPVDAYVEHATGRRALVFARSVPLAEEYAESFNTRGIAARMLCADTPWAERQMYLDAFRRGAVQVLVNVYVLTEGFDDPGVSCCIIARGCGSAGMYLQMIGRVLRPAPGKTNAVVLDLRGVSHEHGLPTDEREYSLRGQGIRLRDPNAYCPVCGMPRRPPAPCAGCGYAPSGDDATKPDTVVGVSLKPYQAACANDDVEMRAVRLARWMSDARRRGFKDGWWRAKFNAVYGARASALIIAKARELAGAA